jgi:hypothetical protein
VGGEGSGRKAQGLLKGDDEIPEGEELTQSLPEDQYPADGKLDPEMHCKMVVMAAKGATNAIIAKASLIHPDTYQMWIKKGKDDPEKYPHFAHLYNEVERVRAELAVEMSSRVIEAANSGLPNTWQAAATFLERRYPDDWSRNERREIKGDDSRPQINVLVLNDPDARDAHQRLLGRIASDTARTGESIGPGVRGELEAGQPGE